MATNLKELRTELEARKAAIEAQTAPLYAEIDKVRAQAQPLNDRVREIGKQIAKIERESGLSGLSRDIAHIARTDPTTRTLVNDGVPNEPTPAQ